MKVNSVIQFRVGMEVKWADFMDSSFTQGYLKKFYGNEIMVVKSIHGLKTLESLVTLSVKNKMLCEVPAPGKSRTSHEKVATFSTKWIRPVDPCSHNCKCNEQ